MELAGRRESSLKRRAAAAVSAENAAGRADDLMKRMLEDATRSENGGSVGVLSSEPHTTGNVTSGGMLDALGPVLRLKAQKVIGLMACPGIFHHFAGNHKVYHK